ncbi:MAG: site-specific integrase [Planctomycetaceae bacterium]|jgi:integrase|nr:site-specific integrase [Planctomycetaceae bacterium]
MASKTPRVPKYCRHPNGQAYLSYRGKPVYLGRFGSEESKEAYDRFIAKLALSRQSRVPQLVGPSVDPITVNQLCLAYLDWAEGWYSKDGKPTTKYGQVKACCKILRGIFGSVPVDEFGPLALQAVQAHLVDRGLTRVGVNTRIGAIRRVFKWGVSQELVPSPVYQALTCVSGLRIGRTSAPETTPIGPVDDRIVDATLPELSPVVADMVQFQRLTGARPGEICILRPCDVDRSEEIWVYKPASHKTQHHGKARLVYIGPKAQDLLRRYLLRDPAAPCFSPAESAALCRERRHEKRKTPLSCGNRPGTNRTAHPERKPGILYTQDTYRRAIHKAIGRINAQRRKAAKEDGEDPELLPLWSPNRLRHTAATEIRRAFGLEAAQVTLGHAKADVTQIYAERDSTLAREVAKRIG